MSAAGFPHRGSLIKQVSPESWVRILASTAAAKPRAQGSGRLTFFHVVLELLFFIMSPSGLGIRATVSQACGSLYSTLCIFTKRAMSPGSHLRFSHITLQLAATLCPQ